MDRQDALQKHTTDMLAIERHILEAIGRQRRDEKVRRHPEANALVIKMERVLEGHVEALEGLADEYGADFTSAVKKTLTAVLGAAAGLYDKVREHELSRIMRDNYTALSLAAMSYTAFHTFGLAVGEEKVSDLALRHLKDMTPILVDISKVLPLVVAEEVGEVNTYPVDGSVGPRAVANTQQAWAPGVTHVA